jgi:hypothetical protein
LFKCYAYKVNGLCLLCILQRLKGDVRGGGGHSFVLSGVTRNICKILYSVSYQCLYSLYCMYHHTCQVITVFLAFPMSYPIISLYITIYYMDILLLLRFVTKLLIFTAVSVSQYSQNLLLVFVMRTPMYCAHLSVQTCFGVLNTSVLRCLVVLKLRGFTTYFVLLVVYSLGCPSVSDSQILVILVPYVLPALECDNPF